jgi:hypothetical protein
MRGPWKCPFCKYISTRNWNVKSHIDRKHGRYGIPVHLLRSKATIISNSLAVMHTTDESVKNFYLNHDSIFKTLINQNDQREILLYDILEQISPQFREMEQLLISARIDHRTMQLILANAIISAVSSHNPIESINDSLKICYLFSTSTKMINSAAYVLNIVPASAKEILKLFLQTSSGQ